MTQQHTGATPIPDTAPTIDGAKVHNPKDFAKVYDYFYNIVGTTLDCMIETGIVRWSITWYVSQMQSQGLIQIIKRDRDQHTGCKAAYYSTNPELWKNIKREPTLFDEFFEKEGGQYGL